LIEINDASEQIDGFWLIAQNSAVPGLYVMPYGGHRSTPLMLAALAGVVHDSQGANGQ
jgi:hypothetical protein